MIVVDVGCYDHGGEPSIPTLIRELKPDVLFGFDPHPKVVEGRTTVSGTPVFTRRLAAWWESPGPLNYEESGNTSGVDEKGEQTVECFDLAVFLANFPEGEVVLKLNIEGGEYPLLHDLADTGEDRRIAQVVVAWHHQEAAHGLYAARPELACPVQEWSADWFR